MRLSPSSKRCRAIVLLSGPSGCGKTTLCRRIASLARTQGLAVAGVITPPRFQGEGKIGMDVEDVSSGLRRPLAERSGGSDGPCTGAWHFHAAALAWGAAMLQQATPCDVLIVDELGPLELERGEGWASALEVLRGGGYRLALVVVRPELVARLRHLLEELVPMTLTVTRENQDTLLGQIVPLLGDKE